MKPVSVAVRSGVELVGVERHNGLPARVGRDQDASGCGGRVRVAVVHGQRITAVTGARDRIVMRDSCKACMRRDVIGVHADGAEGVIGGLCGIISQCAAFGGGGKTLSHLDNARRVLRCRARDDALRECAVHIRSLRTEGLGIQIHVRIPVVTVHRGNRNDCQFSGHFRCSALVPR